MVCESMGGYLAEDTGAEVNEFLSGLAAEAKIGTSVYPPYT